METREYQAAIEAILFASGEPVPLARLAQALEVNEDEARFLTEGLMERYARQEGGILLRRLDDAYQLCSDPAYASYVRTAMDLRRNTPLSQAAMEVLAVVAYNQPVTKAFVEQVRGVDCSAVMQGLVAKGLVEEKGRLELPGRPLLYGTTPHFLLSFGLTTLEDLPPLPEKEDALAQDEAPDADDADTEESAAQAEEQPVPPEEGNPMIVLYILLGILALLLILLLIPVQVGVGYQNDLTAWVRYGLIKIRLYPVKEKPKTKKPSGAKKQTTKKAEPKKKKSSTSDKLSEIAENMKRDSLSETLEEVQQLMQLIQRTTKKLLRALTIDRLYLSLIVAAGEADTTAIRYGQACAVIAPAATMLHETMRVKKQYIEVTPGFGMDKSRVTADIRVHVVPLRIVIIALAALMGFIQWTNTAQTPEKG